MRLLMPTFSPLPSKYRAVSRRAFLLACVAVPPLLVTIWEGAGWAGAVSALIGALWFSLVPVAFHSSRATAWACLSATVLFLVTLITLPLHTAAFAVDAWSTLVMAALSLPTRWTPPRRIKVAASPRPPVRAPARAQRMLMSSFALTQIGYVQPMRSGVLDAGRLRRSQVN